MVMSAERRRAGRGRVGRGGQGSPCLRYRWDGMGWDGMEIAQDTAAALKRGWLAGCWLLAAGCEELLLQLPGIAGPAGTRAGTRAGRGRAMQCNASPHSPGLGLVVQLGAATT